MRNLAFILPLLPLLVACGGRMSADANGDDEIADNPPAASSDASSPETTFVQDATADSSPSGDDGTFSCPSFEAPFTRYNVGATRCALATEFCVSNASADAHSCQPFGSVCHSCECVIRGLSDPDDEGYVPFTYAPPTPTTSGCFGDAGTGVTLYLTE